MHGKALAGAPLYWDLPLGNPNLLEGFSLNGNDKAVRTFCSLFRDLALVLLD